MAVIFFASFAGSPGVTSTAVGLTMAWPKPCLLVEADIAKPSGVLPGYLRGQMDHSRGLTPLSVLHQRGQLTPRSVWEQTVRLDDDRYLVPGFSNILAARGAGTAFWNTLGTTLAAIATQGADVLVDAGRLGVRDDRAALLQLADLVVVVTHPVLPDIAAVNARRRDLSDTVAQVGHDDWLGLLIIDTGEETFRDGEITRAVRLPVLGRVANDPRAAAVYSVGAEPTAKTRRSAFTRDLAILPNVFEQAIKQRRDKLGVIPVEEAAS